MNKIKYFMKCCISRFKAFFRSSFITFKKWFKNNGLKFLSIFGLFCMIFSFGTCYGVINYNRFSPSINTAYADVVSSDSSGLSPPLENGKQYSYHSIVSFNNLLTAKNSSFVDSSSENIVFTTLADYLNNNNALQDNFFDVYSSSRGASDSSGVTRLLLETYRFRLDTSYNTNDRGRVSQYKCNNTSNWYIAFNTGTDSGMLNTINCRVYDAYFEFYNSFTCTSLSTITKVEHNMYYSTKYLNSVVNSYRLYTDKISDSYPNNVGDYSYIGKFEIWVSSSGDITTTPDAIGTNTYVFSPLFNANLYSLLNKQYDAIYNAGIQEGMQVTKDYYEGVVIPGIENGSYEEGKLAGIEIGKNEMKDYYENYVLPSIKNEYFGYGYDKGLKDGANNPTIVIFDAITSGVNNLLNINILPNFTILHFSLIIFSFVMFFMFLHRLQK